MRALDDLGGAIVTADALDKRVVRLAGVFGDEDVAGAPEISRRLAQRAARKQELISKGRLPVHQHHVEPMFEMQILQAVVEHEGIDFPFVDGKTTALHAVLIDQHDHVFQIVCEHVGLIAGDK